MEKRNNAKAQHLVIVLLIFLSIVTLYYLYLHLVSQIHYIKAVHQIQDKQYNAAADELKKSIRHEPNNPLPWKNLGQVHHELAVLKPVKEAFHTSQKARDYYLTAEKLNPLDAETAYYLAREEVRLEKLSDYLAYLTNKKQDHSFQALPYFEKAIRLSPNAVGYHFDMAIYLYSKGRKDELLNTIKTLVRIYPPIYYSLKKEALWSLSVQKACKAGLKQAIEENISAGDAHEAMSNLLSEEKEWPGALSHYKQALQYKSGDTSSSGLMHLGELYVKNRQFQEAKNIFFTSLDLSQTREEDLKRIYYTYKREGCLEQLSQLYQEAKNRFTFSITIDLLMAQTFIELNQYHEAQRILQAINQKKPDAEAYYWLARIAEIEKNWDKMELAIQKATVLEPSNSQYHFIFSQVLRRLKKLARAEKEAGLAIKHRTTPSAWLFNHRAWIRWDKQDYPGALMDWESAITLKPARASFYAHAAEASIQIGNWPLAMDYYQQAITLDPENKDYQKRYREIKAQT
jgi:tetratricopeptide (TPR) repeat protein